MTLPVFILATYGATNILVTSALFAPVRKGAPPFLKGLLSCVLCSSFWVGLGFFLAFGQPPEASFLKVASLGVLYGFIGSGSTWILHVVAMRLGAERL